VYEEDEAPSRLSFPPLLSTSVGSADVEILHSPSHN
jgi:hypothetical protein